MFLDKFVRDLQKKIEQIPGPSAIFYNIFIKRLLSKPELKIAEDIVYKIKQGTLIDLGSGTGYLSIEIAKRMPKLQIYGIDLSRKMVQIAIHHWKHPVKVFNESYRVLKHNGEAWIYDGCYNLPEKETVRLMQKYSFFQYLIFSQIQRLHGFDWEEYHTKITSLLQTTKFKDKFRMELSDGWMKISLKK